MWGGVEGVGAVEHYIVQSGLQTIVYTCYNTDLSIVDMFVVTDAHAR